MWSATPTSPAMWRSSGSDGAEARSFCRPSCARSRCRYERYGSAIGFAEPEHGLPGDREQLLAATLARDRVDLNQVRDGSPASISSTNGFDFSKVSPRRPCAMRRSSNSGCCGWDEASVRHWCRCWSGCTPSCRSVASSSSRERAHPVWNKPSTTLCRARHHRATIPDRLELGCMASR